MKSITLFQNCQSTEGTRVAWQRVFEMIQSDCLLEVTHEVRRAVAARNNRRLHELKSSRLPAIMPCCDCTKGRDLLHLKRYTGYAQVDFDHLTPERLQLARERLMADPHVLLLHTSASGMGLHVFYRYEEGNADEDTAQLYLQAFRQGNRYFSEVACAEADTAMEPAVHLASLCHDPAVHFNPKAVPFRVDMSTPIKKPTQRERVTNEAPVAQGQWTDSWTGDEVCQMALEWRQRREEYVRGNRHHFLVGLAFLLSDLGVEEQTASLFMERTFPDYTDESLSRLVNDCYRRSRASFGMRRLPSRRKLKQVSKALKQTTKTTRNKRHEPTRVEQIGDFLAAQPLRFDVLSRKVQIRKDDAQWTDITDHLENDLYMACSAHLGMNFQSGVFHNVLHSSIVPHRHPLRDYIQNLPPWDDSQPDYIREVLSMVTVTPEEQDLWLWAARKWFVAMVAGWMLDGAVNHEVLVLIGGQGIYKTTWIESLMPPPLRQYCSKQASVRFLDKDEQLRATEYGLINLDEIDSLTDADLNALKSLVSTTSINVRVSYGRNKECRPRVASYAASGNKDTFLTDQTGNRRWLPFHVESIENPFQHQYPYEGLYAQAWHLVTQGFPYWFDKDDILRMEQQTQHFSVLTPEEQLLPVYFQRCQRGTPNAVMLTPAEILAKLINYGNIRRPVSLRQLGIFLSKMGYVHTIMRGRRGYIVLEKTFDSINAERHLNARESE